MLITGYGAQAVMRDSRDQLEMAIYRMPEWLQWTPPGILASFAVSGNWGWVDISWWIILVSGTATVGVWGLVFRSLSRSYEQLHHGLTRADNEYLPELKTPGDLFSGRKGIGYWWSSLLNRRMTRSVDERIGFWITRTMLSRDHDFRMRIWPTFGITIAFFGIGLYTGELVDPLVERGRNAALTISAIYSLSLPLPAIFHALQFSKHHESAWILSVAPIRDPALFARGVDKAILLLIMFPFLCLVLIVLATTWSSMASVVLHTLAASLLVAQSTYLTSAIAFRVIPFSRPLGRGEMLGSIAPLLATTGTYAMTMGGIHYLATSNYIWFSGYLGLMVGVTILLRIYAQQQIRRKCNLEVFHAEN